jgi:hypothetical protein
MANLVAVGIYWAPLGRRWRAHHGPERVFRLLQGPQAAPLLRRQAGQAPPMEQPGQAPLLNEDKGQSQ